MRVLLVGAGGRENAIAEVLARDAELYVVAGHKNPGIARLAKDYALAKETDVPRVLDFALKWGVDMAFIGPEAPLEKGIVNVLEENGVPTVGPTREAAMLETNKAFARWLMEEYKIPGRKLFKVFDDVSEMKSWIDDFGRPVVVKPLGLTGGKGVKVVGYQLKDNEEAKAYAEELIKRDGKVLIEERTDGVEFTFQVFTDGKRVVPMPLAQDYPHAYEGDVGPITGGMGSYSCEDHRLPFITKEDYEKALETLKATVEAMRKNGTPYKGILYGQFMLAKDEPKIIEFNARFGDPEAMNVLPILKRSLVEIGEEIVDGNLKGAEFERKATVVKYIAPKGYPTNPVRGIKLHVDEAKIREEGARVYYASLDENFRMLGSRALAVVGIADSLEEAERIASAGIRHVRGEIFYRKDVGTRESIARRIELVRAMRGE
ncbi:phosphoribosylamine-glycine ligase [Thermococcus kodakarensis KOD1]|uniref:Phosphoribosylamine--glycine ligase n=1 Tax=Thermococcus kodakarensis (strain ATCC BAA-918 / JCM 12380 / KOD1) TaxID=69014 RepID=PUR2_THEKO|nr:phosphoribosylamine--glycine ligase [Thermococcus kodakarensis]Q5JFP1.1 RecName: Full=Phosphoribosylamine--glycine ligase; AltName: Full=GARS; AltName: Full=Glycinamide ribonucleotide synthetase; AltName: Full=Phosphoribosylglycinamide synthetase [Thermococcus kodakarensis KOD1]WCN29151.1 phosphoribosylamine--glycine ligase [Thermococcus kodakarensis]WCN31457.1 phosphoribosylamine--glycine ligase [Thermococcus kodakarensis]BAD84393.1 phosphoribosylamine-glycine ligase [Thermococcus kodakaren